MKTNLETLTNALSKALSIRPKVGGFPVMAKVLYLAGVETNQWFLPSCNAIYTFQNEAIMQQGTPLIQGFITIPSYNEKALINAIRKDQRGESTFPEFLQATWDAGIVEYLVDFKNRSVCYKSYKDEQYTEHYPDVDLNQYQ